MQTLVGFSGGKDSTVMAHRMAALGEDFALLFTPTGNELPGVAEYVEATAKALGRELVIPSGPSLATLIDEFESLPNNRQRWCTRMIKIQPCKAYLLAHPGSTLCVGLRADEEERQGMYGAQATYRFPLREWGWDITKVLAYAQEHNLKVPPRTVTPETFIYSGGQEEGFAVGFVNYPRFPSAPDEIRARAIEIADLLIAACCQKSGTAPHRAPIRSAAPQGRSRSHGQELGWLRPRRDRTGHGHHHGRLERLQLPERLRLQTQGRRRAGRSGGRRRVPPAHPPRLLEPQGVAAGRSPRRRAAAPPSLPERVHISLQPAVLSIPWVPVAPRDRRRHGKRYLRGALLRRLEASGLCCFFLPPPAPIAKVNHMQTQVMRRDCFGFQEIGRCANSNCGCSGESPITDTSGRQIDMAQAADRVYAAKKETTARGVRRLSALRDIVARYERRY